MFVRFECHRPRKGHRNQANKGGDPQSMPKANGSVVLLAVDTATPPQEFSAPRRGDIDICLVCHHGLCSNDA